MSNLVQQFLNNTHPIDYRYGVEKTDHELATGLIDLFGGDQAFADAIPTVTSIGVEAVLNNDQEVMDFFDRQDENLLIEMYLIGTGMDKDTKHAEAYILDSTDGEYTEEQIDIAVNDESDRSHHTTIDIRKWIVHHAASELCGNYKEYLAMVGRGEVTPDASTA